MANFDATFTSSGFKPTNFEAFKKDIDRIAIVGEDVNEICTKKEGYTIYGNCWPEFGFYEGDECDYNTETDGAAFDEFVKIIQKYLKPKDNFTIQAIGAEKCRFPLSGWECKITKRKVKKLSF